jgi:hypothetical protein
VFVNGLGLFDSDVGGFHDFPVLVDFFSHECTQCIGRLT